MSELPIISARAVVKALRKIGYEFDHQRGSHSSFGKPSLPTGG